MVSTLAASYIHARNAAKYSCEFCFSQLRLRLYARWTHLHLTFLGEFGRQLTVATGVVHKTAFLFQRLSVVIRRYKSVLIYKSFGDLDLEPDIWPFVLCVVNFCFYPFGSLHLTS